jgi:two-component system chemotaxis sensor kinase CheA
MSSDGSVLVVEDDEVVSHAIQSALEQEGFGVRLAHNCAAGIELAMARMPSLLILDLALPDGSGWSVLESIRGNLRGVDVPVIVMSSGTVTRSELRCHGVARFLPKPFDMAQCVEAVAEISIG